MIKLTANDMHSGDALYANLLPVGCYLQHVGDYCWLVCDEEGKSHYGCTALEALFKFREHALAEKLANVDARLDAMEETINDFIAEATRELKRPNKEE